MRRGREYYSKNYEKVMDLHEKGLTVKEIASSLNISYSCVYHWIKGLRKPDLGKLNEFESFLKKNGPLAAVELEEKFPKHNELFLTASKRGIAIKRYVISRKLGNYSTWYFIHGQENKLKERIKELLDKYKEIKGELLKLLDKI